MNKIKNSLVLDAIQSGNFENYYECLANDELLWLHAHIGSTIAGYEQLAESERDLVSRLAMPMWQLVVPTLEHAMRRRCIDFTAIASAQFILQEHELKDCPFCAGSANILAYESQTVGICEGNATCHVCGARVDGWGRTVEEAEQSAMREWNRRT